MDATFCHLLDKACIVHMHDAAKVLRMFQMQTACRV